MARNRQIKVARDHLRYCLARAKIASLIGAVLYPLFGLSSFPTMLHFDSNLTPFDTTWPRLVFTGLPMVGLFFLLRIEKWGVELRLILWSLGFSILNCISASIKVWPIAVTQPEILLYFSSANNLILVSSSIFLAFPPRVAIFLYASYGVFFIAPILYLASADSHVFFVIANDSFLATGVCVLVAMMSRVQNKAPIDEKHQHLDQTSKFLDHELHSAIESGDVQSLSGRRDVFILQIDVRKYTQVLKEHDHDDAFLIGFSQDLHAMVRNTIREKGGKMHKTAGDGYLCLFLDRGDEYRRDMMNQAVEAFAEISRKFSVITKRYDVGHMNICGGLHYGSVMFAIFGTETQQEYDVVSKNLSLAGRLEQHSKPLQNQIGRKDILILSPDAIQHLDKARIEHPIERLSVGSDPIRCFNEIEEIYYIAFD